MAFRLAVRRLLHRPVFSLLLVAIVGAGIGAATTVYSVVDQLLLRPVPFAHADRLVDVMDTNRKTRGGGNTLTPEKIAGWQAQPALFERFEALMPAQFDVNGDAEPERITGWYVSVELFDMLGVTPRLGRAFTAGDGRAGGERIAIISDDIWRRRYGADSDALGRTIVLNDQPYTIVGVMARRFRLQGDKDAVWLPVDISANRGQAWLNGFYGIGRLARGVSVAAAKPLADTLADRMQAAAPLARSWDLMIEKKKVAYVDADTRTALFVLLGAVALVLFITCANVANLFLSHTPLRLREMAICSALGSGRRRLVASVLLESSMVALAGGLLGVLLANWGVSAMLAAAPPDLAFRTTSVVEVDARVIAVAIAMTLLTGVVIGLLPAVRGSRQNIDATLRSMASAARSSFGRAPSALVMFEVAFSVILLTGTALMARTLVNLEAIEPGFDLSGVIAMHVDLPSDRYPTTDARTAFFDAAFARLMAVPGVSAVALSTGTPPSQGSFSWGALEGEGGIAIPGETTVPFNTVSAEYFQTLRIPIVAGRIFESTDGTDAAIVSRGLAERLWPRQSAVGHRFRLGSTWRIVVGVASNVESRAAGRQRTDLQFYSPLPRRSLTAPAPQQGPRRRNFAYRVLLVRAQDPIAALADIKRQIWSIDPAQPIERVALLSDLYTEAFGRQRFVLQLMSVFAAIAIALTAAGIFGVLSQVVARRTREIGIRMALGAQPADVMRQILSRGAVLTAGGVLLGVAGALALTRVLGTLLFGVSPTDPVSFAVVTAVLAAVALGACYWPAKTAIRIDPASALRVE